MIVIQSFPPPKFEGIDQLFPEFPETDIPIHRTQLAPIFRIRNKNAVFIKDTVALGDKPSLIPVVPHPAEYLA
jgi:hypothetical protein